jgi:hypothetical protein
MLVLKLQVIYSEAKARLELLTLKGQPNDKCLPLIFSRMASSQAP